MRLKILFSITTLLLSVFNFAIADEEYDARLRYFVIMAEPSAEVWDLLVSNPINPEASAKEFVASIEGAKLIDYYLLAGKPMNLAIVAMPDSRDASAILYQRMATGFVDSIEIFEVIPGDQFADVLGAAKALRKNDSYSEER